MKRILVCDDDHEIVQAICVYLTDAGFEIVRAYSGKEALQCVLDPDQQIDLIIMDVMMPEVNGIEATKKIRELYNIPIIMLSAKSEDEDKIIGSFCFWYAMLERPTHRQNYMKIFGERFRSTPKILWLFIFVIYVKRLRSIPRIHVMSK